MIRVYNACKPGTYTVNRVGWSVMALTKWLRSAMVVPHAVKNKIICQHRKIAVARTAFMRDVKKLWGRPSK